MKRETRKILSITLGLALITCIFSACDKDKEQIKDNSGNQVISGEIQNAEDLNTYGNGGGFVQYKGKTYYREYRNADIEKSALMADYGYETSVRNSKYINAISSNGKIINVFEDDGYGNFYIMSDRFYFSGYNNKLYSVDMNGKDYREICKGYYVKCDEANHQLYYVNTTNNGALYVIDTETLKITKITNEALNILEIFEKEILHTRTDTNGNLIISKLNIEDNTDVEIATIKASLNFNSETNGYYVADSEKVGDKIFLSVGYDDGTARMYTDGNLYCLDLSNYTCNLIEKGIDRKLLLRENEVYYTMMVETPYLKKIDANDLRISIISDFAYTIAYDTILDTTGQGLKYLDDNLTPKTLVSSIEEDKLKEKYGVSNGDSNYIVTIKNIEFVKNKVYYLMELSRYNEDVTMGWRDGYDRVASEVYMVDTSTNKKTLLYMYKAADKEEIDSGDVYDSSDVEEPLAENEMYLEIKLSDRGLKDTFEVRVEEVGGLIIGKRIEYEGTHSRSEGMLKIKVTKEVGAMLTVYIDGKPDTQMVIEE